MDGRWLHMHIFLYLYYLIQSCTNKLIVFKKHNGKDGNQLPMQNAVAKSYLHLNELHHELVNIDYVRTTVVLPCLKIRGEVIGACYQTRGVC